MLNHRAMDVMDKKNVGLFAISAVVHVLFIYILDTQVLVTKVTPTTSKPVMSAQLVKWLPPRPVEKATQAPVPKKEIEVSQPSEATPQPHVPPQREKIQPIENKQPLDYSLVDIVERVEQPAPSAQAILSAGKQYFERQRGQSEQFVKSARATTSLMTGKPKSHEYQVVYKSEEQKRQVKIYCDSGAKKTIAAISGLLRGTIACEEKPDLSNFLPSAKK